MVTAAWIYPPALPSISPVDDTVVKVSAPEYFPDGRSAGGSTIMVSGAGPDGGMVNSEVLVDSLIHADACSLHHYSKKYNAHGKDTKT